ncbi:N-acetyl-gamma-glutamyl-phosphate reductase [Leadbetterella byssophila DSM 17132]|uniref:N-acetyl-gamma-glutamyl-phosphate reductase n=1 Tax=Leadbetterella byssophila (strain DSM 17132 / JCM 16389 / KACC 11308 / NBRC 106382 / 4M15) TaxID=649349 RepID=E4RRW6_LEAB4|nr:N-acetyl-gamma-glutamyl-phosphate reductase [Leadbetterella byssophila]ADQ17653.1 N-acetyl-gamma-glutamyl-phosphate reductase [Leadbetterella byssophila DSM 17132]
MRSIKVGIIGAAGYTGGELLRILIHHPQAELVFANSQSQAGKPVYVTHTDLLGDTDLVFTADFPFHEVDVIFLCSGHGQSKKFLSEHDIPSHVKIIDLSTDFRDESEGFVYGLPELNRDRIKTAQRLANPGCFATAIQLALLPMANLGKLGEVHVSAVTGSTGAGQALSASTHFSWRNNNISIYKAFTHQHLKEIKQSLGRLQTGFSEEVNFIPYRGNFTRGIMANVYFRYEGSLEEAVEAYQEYYASHPFVHLSASPIDVKQVVNSNKCIIELQKEGDKLLITSIIDNLVKGASGQAVQNMNLMFGLEEKAGLQLKTISF